MPRPAIRSPEVLNGENPARLPLPLTELHPTTDSARVLQSLVQSSWRKGPDEAYLRSMAWTAAAN